MKNLSKTQVITEERLYEILTETLNDFSGSIGKRFDGMDSRLDGMDEKISDLKNDMYTKFDMVVRRLDDIDANLIIQGNQTDTAGIKLENHEKRIKSLENAKN